MELAELCGMAVLASRFLGIHRRAGKEKSVVDLFSGIKAPY
jgi:hypothetical protein